MKLSVSDGTIGGIDWDNFDLDRGQTKTILAYFANGMPEKANVIVAIDYRFLGRKWRWFQRFDGIRIENWHWSKQPMDDMEPYINKVVDRGLEMHYKAIERRQHPN